MQVVPVTLAKNCAVRWQAGSTRRCARNGSVLLLRVLAELGCISHEPDEEGDGDAPIGLAARSSGRF